MIWFIVASVFAGMTLFVSLNPDLSDLELLFGPIAIAAAIIWLTRLVRRSAAGPDVIVDGSNVLYWKDGTPRLEAVQDLLKVMRGSRTRPIVMFDANAGYLVANKYLHDQDFARMLKMPKKDVVVVPKGTPADKLILEAARSYNVRIVTNDQFKDWIASFPEVADPGKLIKGKYTDGKIKLYTYGAPKNTAS